MKEVQVQANRFDPISTLDMLPFSKHVREALYGLINRQDQTNNLHKLHESLAKTSKRYFIETKHWALPIARRDYSLN